MGRMFARKAYQAKGEVLVKCNGAIIGLGKWVGNRVKTLLRIGA
ncbi:hypothetical protein OK016_19155 [Vibrio chagasii]|nr:hypothetical protein [Vibrio chagasii]